ncbi:hypothetical protein [Pontimonas salivibrio]|nr:hypothetical protein [Pontimonas salivibrio]
MGDQRRRGWVKLTTEQWERLGDVSGPHTPDYPYGFVDTMGGR